MLMNSGSIASLRRKVGLLDVDEEEQQGLRPLPGPNSLPLGAQPQMAGPMGTPAPAQLPMSAMQAPPKHAGLLAEAAPKSVLSLLTPTQKENVVPGLWKTIGNFLNEGKGRREQVQDRIREQFEMEALGDKVRHEREGDASAAAMLARRNAAMAALGPVPSDFEGQQAMGRKIAFEAMQRGDKDYFPIVGQMFPHLTPDQPRTTSQNVTWSVENAIVDGRPMKIRTSNTGLNTDMDGRPLIGRNVQPWAPPQQPQAQTVITGVDAAGQPIFAGLPRGSTTATPITGVTPSQKGAAQFREILPTVTQTIANLRALTPEKIDKLSTWGVNAATIANKSADTPGGMALAGIANTTGLIGEPEQHYAQWVRAIGDAVARANEVGVLTNQDINRYESQVSFIAGESAATKRQKVKNAIAWAEWMTRNAGAIGAGNRAALPPMPGETEAEYKARTTKSNPYR